MTIGGLQKLTLLDFPGRIACTVFTAGCNFRCPFCHNAPLVTGKPEETVPLPHFFDFLESRKHKLDGVCVSGGEPLLHPDISDFIKKIKSMGFAVKLDTNGSFPQTLKRLIDENLLDYVAMDIKNCLSRYPETAGVQTQNTALIEQSARLLMSGSVPYEFRTTVFKPDHDAAALRAISEWLSGAKAYYLQYYRESDDLVGEAKQAFTQEEMEAARALISANIPSVAIRPA